MATRDLTSRFAELRVLRHGVGGLESKRPGDAFSESGLLDVSVSTIMLCTICSFAQHDRKCCWALCVPSPVCSTKRLSFPDSFRHSSYFYERQASTHTAAVTVLMSSFSALLRGAFYEQYAWVHAILWNVLAKFYVGRITLFML